MTWLKRLWMGGTFRVSDEDKAAIARFRQAGNKFGVVTGRDLEMSFWVKSNCPELDFIISCTGAMICDGDGKLIYEKKQIADDKLKDVAEFAVSHGAGSFSISDRMTRHYVDVRGNIPTDFSKIKEFNQCCTWFYDQNNAEKLVNYINEKYPGEFSGYRNGGAVDMPPAGVSKSTGVLAYAAMFDNPEIYTVGDNYNDLGMILNSKAGFLFRSTEKIKQDYPQLPAFEEYDDLLDAISKAL